MKPRARVLVVDDEHDIRDELREWLVDRGFEVICAADGAAGLGRFEPGLFDAIITDVKMPRMGGVQLIQEIRRVDRHIPVIVITGHRSRMTLDGITAGEPPVVLEKPLSLAELGKLLAAMIPDIGETGNRLGSGPRGDAGICEERC